MKKIFILITIFFSFLLTDSVFALDTKTVTNKNGISYTVPKNDSYTDLIVTKGGTDGLGQIMYFNENTLTGNVYYSGSSSSTMTFPGLTSNNAFFYFFSYNSNSPISSFAPTQNYWEWYNVSNYTILYSTVDIYNGSNVYYSSDKISLPTISYSVYNVENDLDGSISSKTIKFDFSIEDTTKYIYQYSKDTYNFIDMNDNLSIEARTIKFNVNGFLIVRILDKETNSLVVSASYTVSGITESLPNVSITKLDDTSCTTSINGTEYIVCTKLQVSVSHMILTKYRIYYSYDNGETWNSTAGDGWVEVIDYNCNFIVKVLGRDDNKYINSASYNITTISTDYSQLGQYISFRGELNNDKTIFNLKTYFYNFDNTNYNYYYSIGDNGNFTEITETYEVGVSNVYYFSYDFFQYDYILIKITDKEGNYVTSATYTVNVFSDLKNTDYIKSISNFLNSISDYTNLYKDLFNTGFLELNNDIRSFIVSVFILAILCGIVYMARRK